ncbi:hypothetical protein N864_08360 [Intrasporangium chromatireducens Q5-1]|uniref:Uncharacterized protein n=1 Tax=Intrasporangium chromatireducens Q5-1 TaxID=584657 RepID=W9GRA6_9MICO|nr:hypothetical protein [Intrasporangium chromatireducens]EWT07368.1 hypothetical protein N864_08360 [Intrasporangium chromatireducens Q5-1]
MNERPAGSRSRLGLLLDEVVADVPEVDFTQTAWRGAQHQRRLRVVLAAVVAAVLALGAGWQWIGSHGVDRGMQPVPARTTRASAPIRVPTLPPPTSDAATITQPAPWIDPRGWVPGAGGTLQIRLPDVTQYADLPNFDAGDHVLMSSPSGSRLSARPVAPLLPAVTAVYLEGDQVRPPASTYHLVIQIGSDLVAVDSVTLTAEQAEKVSAGSGTPLSADGSELVFAQPGGVVVVDLVTHAVHSLAVPDPGLTSAGWSVDDVGAVIAHSALASWHIDLTTGRVRRTMGQENDSRYGARAGRDGALVVNRYGPSGVTSTNLGSGLGTPTGVVKSAGDRVAIGADGTSIVVADLGQAHAAGRAPVKVLTSRSGFPVSPVGWDPSGRYLHLSAFAGGGDYLLVWDVETGGIYKAMRVNSAGPQSLPIALGAGYARD